MAFVNAIANMIGAGGGFLSAVSRIISAFRTRVAADGGTSEATSCLRSSLTSLRGIDIYPVGDAVMIALRDRAVADSGTFEAYNCGIIAVQQLANIDLD